MKRLILSVFVFGLALSACAEAGLPGIAVRTCYFKQNNAVKNSRGYYWWSVTGKVENTGKTACNDVTLYIAVYDLKGNKIEDFTAFTPVMAAHEKWEYDTRATGGEICAEPDRRHNIPYTCKITRIDGLTTQ